MDKPDLNVYTTVKHLRGHNMSLCRLYGVHPLRHGCLGRLSVSTVHAESGSGYWTALRFVCHARWSPGVYATTNCHWHWQPISNRTEQVCHTSLYDCINTSCYIQDVSVFLGMCQLNTEQYRIMSKVQLRNYCWICWKCAMNMVTAW